jgi:Na+/H+ antiporter NhaD/arsenite permease-like protein
MISLKPLLSTIGKNFFIVVFAITLGISIFFFVKKIPDEVDGYRLSDERKDELHRWNVTFALIMLAVSAVCFLVFILMYINHKKFSKLENPSDVKVDKSQEGKSKEDRGG